MLHINFEILYQQHFLIEIDYYALSTLYYNVLYQIVIPFSINILFSCIENKYLYKSIQFCFALDHDHMLAWSCMPHVSVRCLLRWSSKPGHAPSHTEYPISHLYTPMHGYVSTLYKSLTS